MKFLFDLGVVFFDWNPEYFFKNELKLGFVSNWKKTYSLKWLDDDEFDLPEPVNLSYDTKFTISSADFLNLIKEASYVSREICFKVFPSFFSAWRNLAAFVLDPIRPIYERS